MPDQVAVLDAHGAIAAANHAWRAQFAGAAAGGYGGLDYMTICGQTMAAAGDAEAAYAGIQSVLAGCAPGFQMEYAMAGSPQRWFSMAVTPLAYGCQGLVVAHSEITERRQAEADLRVAAIAFESPEGMLVTNADGVIMRVNQAFCAITGYAPDEVVGRCPSMLSSGRHDAAFYKDMWATIGSKGAWEGEIWNRRKNGEVYPERLSIAAVADGADRVTHYVASLSDITVSKAANDEIKSLAFFDPLTRLPNRRLLLDRLRQALAASAANGRYGALMFIDLDNFKTLNDTLGHNIGDLLLQQAAGRLHGSLRQGDTVARLGGDEFVVLVEGMSGHVREAAAQTETLAGKILAALNEPYQLGIHECRSTPSIGATLFHDGRPGTPEDVLKQADIAMYQAKQSGRNGMRFFDQGMQDSLSARARLEGEMRLALERGQFELYFQPQVDQHGCPTGAEALLRWIRPDGQSVPPSSFIPLAEETGLIVPLGRWVLEQACSRLHAWQSDAATSGLVLAINVSARQFQQPGFCGEVHEMVKRHGCNPACLKIELTEGMLLENIEETISSMRALKEIGVRFSLDDFGTGYSSLQYLKRLPLDQLKIDKSFVHDLATDSNDQAIVLTIIAMARSLKLDVIAEGVETEAQRALLERLGCHRYQGYLFGRPMTAPAFQAQLTRKAA
ncbi:EAL domain-containing protein [Duganella sp. FT92W]|uniref:EAL domain-containing protein n=2 Tax=Pseudoduganella rivuli TaxID=2666085 RepID=A0A7X2II11_9BURK|nr:EAL domain-containing protein [Pseudoduganella rivuli]